MGRFETKWLSGSENLAALTGLAGRWIEKVPARAHRRSSCSAWIWARAGPMASRKAPLTTPTSGRSGCPEQGQSAAPPSPGRRHRGGVVAVSGCADAISSYPRNE